MDSQFIGDFSFARSLVLQYRCKNVLATCYDSKEALYAKYPQAEKNIQDIEFGRKRDQEKEKEKEEEKDGSNDNDDEHDRASVVRDNNREDNDYNKKEEEEKEKETNAKEISHHGDRGTPPKVIYSVDARKLGSPGGGGKQIRNGIPLRKGYKYNRRPGNKQNQQEQQQQQQQKKNGSWDVICFNFPHVGGLSTDVNRQVRSNQELLVSFFKACVPLLSASVRDEDNGDNDEDEDDSWQFSSQSSPGSSETDTETEPNTNKAQLKARAQAGGQVFVTLFESEPYTLWNVKDLARHAGLRVVTSFKFPWSSYHGYSHARTLGEIEGKHGGKGGWKGEERDARMYAFDANTRDNLGEGRTKQGDKRKRGRQRSDSDSDST